jgi:hypothetical protein
MIWKLAVRGLTILAVVSLNGGFFCFILPYHGPVEEAYQLRHPGAGSAGPAPTSQLSVKAF